MRSGLRRQPPSRSLLAAAATIGGALVFEHGSAARPCKLCLIQRNPYYVAMPLALCGGRRCRRRVARIGLWLLAARLPRERRSRGLSRRRRMGLLGRARAIAAAAPAPGAGTVGDFLNQLETTRVVSCTEAAWRFLGLSLAGWNVLISLALAALAAAAAARRRGRPSAARARCPSRDSRASCRAGSSAGTGGRWSAGRGRSARRASGAATSRPRGAGGRPFADCRGSRPRRRSPRSCARPWSGGSRGRRSGPRGRRNIGR